MYQSKHGQTKFCAESRGSIMQRHREQSNQSTDISSHWRKIKLSHKVRQQSAKSWQNYDYHHLTQKRILSENNMKINEKG
jgi:hypothetical protein